MRAAIAILLALASACAPIRSSDPMALAPEIDRACRAEAERMMMNRMRANVGRMDEMAGRMGETASAVERERDLDWLTRDRLYRQCLARATTAGQGTVAPR